MKGKIYGAMGEDKDHPVPCPAFLCLCNQTKNISSLDLMFQRCNRNRPIPVSVQLLLEDIESSRKDLAAKVHCRADH